MNLNVETWKEYKLADLFDIEYGNKFDNDKMTHDNPYVAFVSRTSNNNGVSDIVDVVDGVVPYKAGCMTIALGGSIGTTSIQTKPFYTGQNVAVIKTDDSLSVQSKLFIQQIIQKECAIKFVAFGRELNKHIKADFSIYLPTVYNADGTPKFDPDYKYSKDGYIPDFKFMDQYIESLHHKPITTNATSVSAGCEKQLKLGVCDWKEFVLKDLFDIKKGKRLTSDNQEDGNNNYVGAIDSNNGVANHIGQTPIHKGNTISLSYNGSVGEAFYQKDDYWATDDVNALYPKFDNFNSYIGLFISTILHQEKYRFSYGRKWTLDNMKSTVIKLPIIHNPDGLPKIDETHKYSSEGYIPDFEWMENYMKQLPYSDRIGA